MFERFTKDARRIVEDAVEVAWELSAPTVEAEHLLLAAARHEGPVPTVLRRHEVDFDELVEALRAETSRSLAAVGVSAEPIAFSPPVQRPRLATSAKWALELSLRIALERADRRIGTGHVVLAILRAQRGTVPRALQIAGVDRDELTAAVSAAT